ncbi:MAG: PASTA domain-containing protein [Salinivirgaceae bacterium]|nr:PASTA domain-containing protein [Salinivirgaceae bacterium]
MDLIEKLKDAAFWKRNLIRVGKFAGFYLVVFIALAIFLRIYTHHGHTISVPDFKGLNLNRAMQIAKHEDLQLKIIDSTFIDYMPKGCIVDQNPRPGTHVKKNRTIFITTNAFNRAKVSVPKVAGLSYRQGKATLEMHGLRVGSLIYRPDFAKNNILKQMYNGEEIAEGTLIDKGSSIDLVLGDGHGNNATPLPDLKGMTQFEAVNELNNAYLNVGKVVIENAATTTDSMNARVYRQEPAYFGPGARATLGGKVDIWLKAESRTETEIGESINLDD